MSRYSDEWNEKMVNRTGEELEQVCKHCGFILKEHLILGEWCPTKFEAAVSTSNEIEHPSHYTSHPSGIECKEITKHMGFCLGNVIKYVWRADLKEDALKDLRKARQYLDIEIEKREKSAPNR